MKSSLQSECEALKRLVSSSSPRNMAPASWIHQYSDLIERIAKEFDKTEMTKEEDLIESEWHAFQEARRRSKRVRQNFRFRNKQSIDEEKSSKETVARAKQLPPPWESLEVVMDSAEICITLTSLGKRERWIKGFAVLTDWRFVFLETYPEHRANSSEAMSRALGKLKRSAMSFEQFHKLFARTCGQKPLQMLQVPIGCVKSLECKLCFSQYSLTHSHHLLTLPTKVPSLRTDRVRSSVLLWSVRTCVRGVRARSARI